MWGSFSDPLSPGVLHTPVLWVSSSPLLYKPLYTLALYIPPQFITISCPDILWGSRYWNQTWQTPPYALRLSWYCIWIHIILFWSFTSINSNVWREIKMIIIYKLNISALLNFERCICIYSCYESVGWKYFCLIWFLNIVTFVIADNVWQLKCHIYSVKVWVG